MNAVVEVPPRGYRCRFTNLRHIPNDPTCCRAAKIRARSVADATGAITMVQIIAIMISFAAIVAAFFSPTIAWAVLVFPVTMLLLTLLAMKQKRWKHIPELSDSANALLQKYGHFYSMPFAGRDYSSAASTLLFAGVIIGVIGTFKLFWWGITIAAGNYLVMGVVSKAFNPTSFLTDPEEQLAHEEIISFISKTNRTQKTSKTKPAVS
jgi:hypothetical protein